MSNNTKKDYTQLHIHASEHPKAYAPHILILNIVMSVLGAIIGLELIVRTGVAPNTSIVGALFAIIISRIPIAILKKYQSIHCQNLIQTSISGATFSAANCFLLPIGVPVIMGRMDLMYPMLIGSFLATIIDATILYKTFDSEMFPAEGAWPPGVASAESILAVVQKGKKALLLLAGMGIGIGGKMIGIPTDLLGVSWFGDFVAMAALGVGSLVIGIIKTNGFIIDIFGTSLPVITDLFGEGADLMARPIFQYMPHGIMIGAGLISLIQCGRMLLKKSDGNSAAGKFSSSMANMKKALGGGYVAYLIVAVLLAVITGIWSDMSMFQLIIWVIFSAFAAIASELIVGISAMYSGWFPGFATALIFLIVGMLIGFPAIPLGILVAYTSATGPAFSDMAYDLKCGYILRGCGQDQELELEGRKQQYYSEMIGFVVAFVLVAIMAGKYFDQGLFAPVDATFADHFRVILLLSSFQLIIWVIFSAFAAIASELIVGISAMYSGWFPGFATALIFLIVGMLIGFPAIPLGILVAYTSATGPAFSDMAYDLKCGYILRGCGQDQELELEGRKQQYYSEMIGFVVAFVLVAIMAGKYFDQGLFAPVDATFAATIEAGAGAGVAKWLVIWAIPGAIIQLLGGSRQVGILFATGLLVGSTINGLTILIALVLRYVLVKRNKENEQTLNILGAGSLAGAALYSFFTATLSLGKKK